MIAARLQSAQNTHRRHAKMTAPTETAPAVVPDAIKRSFQQGLPGLKLDGLTVDTIAVNFSGSVDLDKEKDAGVLSALSGGNTVRMVVDVWVAKSGGNFPRDKEGDLKAVDKRIGLKVHSIDLASIEVTEKP
jgi:hypothetical protein